MASDTVPAAVPGPGDPAGTTPTSSPAPQPRGLAGLLSAVDPARPTGFHITPTTGTENGTGNSASSASSAAFHNSEDDSKTDNGDTSRNGSGNSGSGRQERSIMRAWLLAGAERWKQGGAARVKRLEMQKARHQANQVKETRTVSVNRSGGLTKSPSGGSGGGKPSAGKSLNSRNSNGGRSTTGPKNSSGLRNGSTGRGGGGSAGGAGGTSGRGSTGGGRGPKNSSATKDGRGPKHSGGLGGGTTKTPGSKDTSGRSKTPKPDNSRGTGSGGTKGPSSGSGGKSNRQAPSGGKSGPQGPSGSSGKSNASSGKSPAPTGKSSSDKPGGRKVDLTKKNSKKTPTGKNIPDPSTTAAGKTTGPDKPGTKPTKTPTTGAGTGSKTPHGKRTPLQESRETGYRDGTRAAKVVAHVEAYRDGVKDGYRDTSKAAAHEKARLDKAHQQRQQQRAKDQAVTASSADHHPTPTPATSQPSGPQPITVTSIDATHIALGDNAARTHISRGEVRSLRRFQQTLQAKTDTMTRSADATKALEAHAAQQVKNVTTLLEQAKAVKGGDSLVAALTKLEDAAKTQAGQAAEIHKRALRAAEASKTLHTNTNTRYGGIYQAVVDSPLTAPAEMTFYTEMAHA